MHGCSNSEVSYTHECMDVNVLAYTHQWVATSGVKSPGVTCTHEHMGVHIMVHTPMECTGGYTMHLSLTLSNVPPWKHTDQISTLRLPVDGRSSELRANSWFAAASTTSVGIQTLQTCEMLAMSTDGQSCIHSYHPAMCACVHMLANRMQDDGMDETRAPGYSLAAVVQ